MHSAHEGKGQRGARRRRDPLPLQHQGESAMELAYGTATAKDLPQMVELLGVLFTDEAEFQPDSGKQKRALEAILGNPTIGRLFVAPAGKRVAALASLPYTVSTA